MKVTFNKIYVIESLPSGETKTGTDLHDDIIRRKLWKHTGFESQLIPINNKKGLLNFFDSVQKEVLENNIVPYFHFEIHGNPNGFCLASGEQVNWIDLHKKFIEINILVRNKIWLSFATCFGAYVYWIIRAQDRAPFYGYIGAWGTINVVDLQASYERFFDVFLEEFEIDNALTELNRSNPNKPVEYKLYTSKDVFKKVYSQYFQDFENKEKFEKRITEIVSETIKGYQEKSMTPPSEDLLSQKVRQLLLQTKDSFMKRDRENFFMIDLYPENEQRFE